jgi:hypothetical protein
MLDRTQVPADRRRRAQLGGPESPEPFLALIPAILAWLGGAWLVVAPFVLGYRYTGDGFDGHVNDVLIGLAILLVASVRMISPPATTAWSYLNVALGLWLIIAPFVLGYNDAADAPQATINDIRHAVHHRGVACPDTIAGHCPDHPAPGGGSPAPASGAMARSVADGDGPHRRAASGRLFTQGTVRAADAGHRPVAGVQQSGSRVPSHGVQSYGQTYAIDLVADPPDGERPRFGWWPLARRPQAFPGFGALVTAPCNGRVARAHDGERDHWSRTSPLGLVYMFTAELLRDLFGPNKVLGNHVVIETADGDFVVLAHLRRGSVRVRTGEQVAAGVAVA